jgi:hypothetical protein
VAEPWVVRRYLRAYRRAAPAPLDPERLALWEPVQLVHDWARAALIAGLGEERPDGPAAVGPADDPGDHIDRRVGERVIVWCRARYGEAIAAADGHPPPST